MSRALRAEEARSCFETCRPERCTWRLAQRFRQIMARSCVAAGSEASICPGHADSGASSESADPDALALAGPTRSVPARAAKAMFRAHFTGAGSDAATADPNFQGSIARCSNNEYQALLKPGFAMKTQPQAAAHHKSPRPSACAPKESGLVAARTCSCSTRG